MQKITARITMSVNVSDEEWNEIFGDNDGDDIDVTGDLLELFKRNGRIDEDYGDSYIPGSWIGFIE